MPETTPLIKAALNLRGGAGFDVYFYSLNKENLLPNRCQFLNKFVCKPHKYWTFLPLLLIQTLPEFFIDNS